MKTLTWVEKQKNHCDVYYVRLQKRRLRLEKLKIYLYVQYKS